MALFAPVWAAHLNTTHLMVPPLLMHVYGLMLVLLASRTLSLIQQIDYAAAIVHIQRRLNELRRWRSRVEWTLLCITGCFMWIPLMLTFFSVHGADLWVSHRRFVYWNVASGFACLGLLYGIVQWLGRRRSERILQALENSRAGRACAERGRRSTKSIASNRNDSFLPYCAICALIMSLRTVRVGHEARYDLR
jgi:hypothetical protein